jgi:hypothetical protein
MFKLKQYKPCSGNPPTCRRSSSSSRAQGKSSSCKGLALIMLLTSRCRSLFLPNTTLPSGVAGGSATKVSQEHGGGGRQGRGAICPATVGCRSQSPQRSCISLLCAALSLRAERGDFRGLMSSWPGWGLQAGLPLILLVTIDTLSTCGEPRLQHHVNMPGQHRLLSSLGNLGNTHFKASAALTMSFVREKAH